MFLLPFALMIFGFSTSSGLSERFSFTGSGAGASSFLAVVFFAAFGAAAGAATAAGVGDADVSAPDAAVSSIEAAEVEASGAPAVAAGAFAFFAGFFSSESAIIVLIFSARFCRPLH